MHATSANKLAHLHSLSTTDLLAQAFHLSGLPLIKSTLLKKLPKLRKSNELRKAPKPSKPKIQGHPFPYAGLPFDTLAVARYKKATNQVHPRQTTLPKEYHILHCIPSNPLISLPPLLRHPPDLYPLESLLKRGGRK